jgi:hypothetical protein
MPRFVHNVSNLICRILFLARPIRQNEAGFVFFALPPHKRWIKYLGLEFHRV